MNREVLMFELLFSFLYTLAVRLRVVSDFVFYYQLHSAPNIIHFSIVYRET